MTTRPREPWLDRLLDRSVVLGYSRIGYHLRRRHWQPIPPGSLTDRRLLITGGTSGIGFATAARCAGLGATVHVLGHNAERGAEAVAELQRQVPQGRFELEQCDVTRLPDVRRFADEFSTRVPALDALVHNAGLFVDERTETPEGHETNLTAHVLAPHLLTGLLRSTLRHGTSPQVAVTSSGGMYAQKLAVDDPEFTEGDYSGGAAYARTKRMQVTIAERWADELAADGIAARSWHPGWVDTPGVRTFLPRFRAVTRPIIRTPEEGADTLVWLLATPGTIPPTGGFWHDRRPRPVHYLSRTKETREERERFWRFCDEAVGGELAQP